MFISPKRACLAVTTSVVAILSMTGVVAAASAMMAATQGPYTIDTYVEPGSLAPGSDEWQAAFSVDQFDTRDPYPPRISTEGAKKLSVTYKGKALGLDIGRVFITADLTDTTYRMTYKVQTDGVVRWLDQTEQDVISYGLLDGSEMTALFYERDEREGDDTKLIELTRPAPGARFRYWTDPYTELVHPVMPDIGLQTVDPLAALAQLGFIEVPEGQEPCTRNVAVYDGRRRFDMRMEPAGTANLSRRGSKRYSGFTYKCRVFMNKVAGYNQKNLEDEFDGDGFVYLAPMPESVASKNFTYMPVFLEGKTGILSATLEAKAPTMILPDGTKVELWKN
ncbi:DUF3108 domain-containing protein [Parvularcula sp. IMCC14364]|uniref:DUF3108 domain-containing protein n=1 Tax=Parvularcula sp. IMCC14364 TaxID=3067902 RepID=UPI0027415239|nr:DUF3108 domain-containing protein [Parvularcula sp. IMCC14364]